MGRPSIAQRIPQSPDPRRRAFRLRQVTETKPHACSRRVLAISAIPANSPPIPQRIRAELRRACQGPTAPRDARGAAALRRRTLARILAASPGASRLRRDRESVRCTPGRLAPDKTGHGITCQQHVRSRGLSKAARLPAVRPRQPDQASPQRASRCPHLQDGWRNCAGWFPASVIRPRAGGEIK